MPVFIFLVFLGAAVLWLLLSFSYRTIGKLIAGILNDAKESMKEEDGSQKNGGKQEHE